MRHWGRLWDVVTVTLLAAVVLCLGVSLRSLAVDDAFITYRFAQNLASGHGFTYNPDRPVLSTTAPLYALLLAAGARAWPDLPALANALYAFALGIASLELFLLGRREGAPEAGALAALLLALSPLLWLSLGLETAVYLALALGAVLGFRSGRLYLTAALLALTTLTRADGLVLTGVIGVHRVLQLLRTPAPQSRPSGLSRSLGAAGIYLATLLPVIVWLMWQFGSPIPVTLVAKQAQARLGVTGFYAHTTFVEGLVILARARIGQSLLYLPYLLAALAGLAALRRAPWVGLLAAWGAAHLCGYTLLGVTPYYWYYAPLAPTMAALAALGIVEASRRLDLGSGIRMAAARGLGAAWATLLVLALLRADSAMEKAVYGPLPPTEDAASKVLPEAKVGVYRRVGEWLRDNTPDGATVGVTEVGVMGYYSGRPMVDFLGLLEPDVARALARGDMYWALLAYQPDYLALTAVAPLYSVDLRADPWFQAAYAPRQTFPDARFWGAPVTVYERTLPRVPMVGLDPGKLPADLVPLDADLGDAIRLVGAWAGQNTAEPGGIVPLILYWQARGPIAKDYSVFVHLLGRHDRVIAQRDAPPGLGARPTGGWVTGENVVDPYLVALPDTAYVPDEAVWEVGIYDPQTGRRLQTADGRDNVRFGAVSIVPSAAALRLDFGPVVLTGYDLSELALAPGQALGVTLRWDMAEGSAGKVQFVVELVGETGNVGARATAEAGGAGAGAGTIQLAPELDAPPGAYNVEVRVVDALTAAPLALLGPDGRPRADRATLTKVRLYP